MGSPPNADLKVVFGAMTFGQPNTLGARVHTADEAGRIVDIFQRHGHREIDTARIYGHGSSEVMLAKLDWQKRDLIMDTKLYPSKGSPLEMGEQYTHSPEDVRAGLMSSLKALQCEKVDMFYLHGPDRKTPIEDTLREVNKLHQEGYFNRFGISNYMSWEVAKICEICEAQGWIKPTVYQGIYNVLHRRIEPELIPCLRHYGISLYAFQPLAGGFLTGRYQRGQTDFEPGSRFDPKILQGGMHHGRYWNDNYFDAIEIIHAAVEKNGFTDAEVAMRWLKHHSQLSSRLGDAIIVGASSATQLEGNLADLEKGPLPDNVLEALETAETKVRAVAPKYWH